MLLDEIDRAKFHPSGKLPCDTVSLGSLVEFLNLEAGTTREVRLVLPADADIDAGACLSWRRSGRASSG